MLASTSLPLPSLLKGRQLSVTSSNSTFFSLLTSRSSSAFTKISGF